jgi:hypothetical protein
MRIAAARITAIAESIEAAYSVVVAVDCVSLSVVLTSLQKLLKL